VYHPQIDYSLLNRPFIVGWRKECDNFG